MSLCDTCPKPGNCCKDFVLNDYRGAVRVNRERWESEGAEVALKHGLPFIPIRIEEPTWATEPDPNVVSVRFKCTKLTPKGRCGDYENRPRLCRDYEAGSDALCALYQVPAPNPDAVLKELA